MTMGQTHFHPVGRFNRRRTDPRNGPQVQLGQDNFALGEKKLVNVARILSRPAPDTSISTRSFA